MKQLALTSTRLAAGLLAAVLISPAVFAQGEAKTVDELLEQVRSGQVGDQAELNEKQAQFDSASSDEQEQLLAQAKAQRDELQETSEALEKAARENKVKYDEQARELKSELGPTAAMFGILESTSSDLIGIFRNSPTSIQYPDRVEWLNAFINRMQKSSEIFSIDEIKRIWFMIQQETTASGKIVRVPTSVLGESGAREQREVIRIGKFNLITGEPRPLYLSWQSENQRASVLKRQPSGKYLDNVGDYVDNQDGLHVVGIDPTGGSLLTRLVDAPSLRDRVDQGGLIGYLILALGAFAVLIAIYKLIAILIISNKVAQQRKHLDKPSSGNPLGRMLRVYENNRNADTETLEMRLGEAILVERPKVDRFVGLLKTIAVVAPLMGLMGTVIGMIATFQAITLFGTGDPKTMAGGISQALVTTVLGLTVAIPTVLLHAVVAARAKSVVNTLKHQTAGLIAERMEEGRDASSARV